MSTVAAIGADHTLEGFALAGVVVIPVVSDEAIQAAWQGLEPDVGLVILTQEAEQVLRPLLPDRPDTLTVVMP